MKIKFIKLLVLFVLLSSNLAFAAAPTAEKPLKMSMTSTFMDTHPVVSKGLLLWAENIKQQSGGRVIIEFYNPNTICPEGDIYDAVVNGLVTIGSHNVTRVRGKFPLARVMDLPFMYSSAEAGAISNYKIYESFPQLAKEFDETHILTFWSSAVDQLHSIKKPFSSIAELKGVQLGAMSGSYIELLQSLGAAAVQVSPSDLYLALQRGQIDGVVCPFAYMLSTKVYESAKKSYVANLKSNGFYLAMNKVTWESLPSDLQKIFEDNSGLKLAQELGQITDKGVLDDLDYMTANGHQVFPINQEELAKMKDLTQGLEANWLKECEAKGLTEAKAILAAAKKNSNEVEAKYAYKGVQ